MEHAYSMFNFGVEEQTSADQITYEWWNRYDSRLGSSDEFVDGVWTANYDGINRCNSGIARIPGINGTTTLRTQAQKDQRLVELRFLRAYYYFQLVQQFGAIPLALTPSEGVQLEYTRAAVPAVYRAIISDLRFAADNLAPTAPAFGRATKNAAHHFLAKAHLTRGSAVTTQRGQKPTDMDNAAYYSEQVSNSGHNPLATDPRPMPPRRRSWARRSLQSRPFSVAVNTAQDLVSQALVARSRYKILGPNFSAVVPVPPGRS